MDHIHENAAVEHGVELGAKIALEAILRDMEVACASSCKTPPLLAGRFKKAVAGVLAARQVAIQAGEAL